MTPSEVLAECAQRGIELRRHESGGIWYSAPKGALTDDLREAIRQHKAELLRLLSAEHPPAPEEARPSPVPAERIISAPPLQVVAEYVRVARAGRCRHEPKGVYAPALGPDGRCRNCGRDRWWLSWWNVLSCEKCAPPPDPDRVRRWLRGEEALRLGNLRTA